MIGGRSARGRGIASAVALVFLAPLVGEYLLGNTPISELAALLMLAPLYGGAALLIREVARRSGRGWPTMIVFAMAYALWEEGPVDMMLWNPTYGGFDMAAAYAGTFVPVLGTSVQMLEDVLSIHTIWSICVPIALVEAFHRDPARPWLGKAGLAITAAVFLAASAMLAVMQSAESGFIATTAELAGSLLVIAALIALGFRIGHRRAPARDAVAPGPWPVGAMAFAVTSLYWCRDFVSETVSPWILALAWLALVAVSATLILRWSTSRGWGPRHRLALAGGAMLTYVWAGYTHALSMGGSPTVAILGSTVLGTAAIALLIAATRSQRPAPGTPTPET